MTDVAVNIISYNPDLGVRGIHNFSMSSLLAIIEKSSDSNSAKSGDNALLNLYSYDLLAAAGEAHTGRDIFERYCELSLVTQLRAFPKKALKLQADAPSYLVLLDWMGRDHGYNITMFTITSDVFNDFDKLRSSVKGKLKVNARFRPNEEHVFANVIDVPLVRRMLKIGKELK